MFFSTAGPMSRRSLKADLGAARLGRRRIDRGAVGCDSHPRPRPVACAALAQSRKKRVGFAGRPSVSAAPSRRRKTRSVTESSSKKKKVYSIPYIYPMNSGLLHDSSINTPHTSREDHTHPIRVHSPHVSAEDTGWLPVRDDAP